VQTCFFSLPQSSFKAPVTHIRVDRNIEGDVISRTCAQTIPYLKNNTGSAAGPRTASKFDCDEITVDLTEREDYPGNIALASEILRRDNSARAAVSSGMRSARKVGLFHQIIRSVRFVDSVPAAAMLFRDISGSVIANCGYAGLGHPA